MSGLFFLDLAKSVFRMAHNLALKAENAAHQRATELSKELERLHNEHDLHCILANDARKFVKKLEELI